MAENRREIKYVHKEDKTIYQIAKEMAEATKKTSFYFRTIESLPGKYSYSDGPVSEQIIQEYFCKKNIDGSITVEKTYDSEEAEAESDYRWGLS